MIFENYLELSLGTSGEKHYMRFLLIAGRKFLTFLAGRRTYGAGSKCNHPRAQAEGARLAGSRADFRFRLRHLGRTAVHLSHPAPPCAQRGADRKTDASRHTLHRRRGNRWEVTPSSTRRSKLLPSNKSSLSWCSSSRFSEPHTSRKEHHFSER